LIRPLRKSIVQVLNVERL
jgi:hypothetical protein